MEDSSRDGAHSRDADWLVMTSIFITTRFSQSEVEIWASTQFREPKFSLQNCFFKSGKIWTAKRHATALERTKSNENKNAVQQKRVPIKQKQNTGPGGNPRKIDGNKGANVGRTTKDTETERRPFISSANLKRAIEKKAQNEQNTHTHQHTNTRTHSGCTCLARSATVRILTPRRGVQFQTDNSGIVF